MKKSLMPLICVPTMLVLVLVLVLGACGSESSDTKDGGSSSQTFSPDDGDGADDSPSEDDPKFENGAFTTPKVKIQILRYKIIKVGHKGNEYGEKPVIAFYYNTTNLSDAKVDPSEFIFHFSAYQDNNPNAENELGVGMLPDDRFLESQSENIKKGGTVESAIAYELDDLTTPVDLVATEGFDEVVGKATYKLS